MRTNDYTRLYSSIEEIYRRRNNFQATITPINEFPPLFKRFVKIKLLKSGRLPINGSLGRKL